MKFIVLGSGTTIPHSARSSSGYWLETENGSLLLDCGASAVHRMAQEKCDWATLDAIWISHFHLDHIGGLAPFLFGTKYAPEMQNRTKPLNIFGPKGLRTLLEKFDRAVKFEFLKQPFPLEITEIEPLEKFEILPGFEAVTISTPHTKESLAIHLSGGEEQTIVYTSDTGLTQDLATLARGADLLVMECSFFKNKPVEMHLELSEAMHLTRSAKPKRVVLTHLYPEWDTVNFLKEVTKFSPPCEVIESKDGLRLEIPGVI